MVLTKRNTSGSLETGYKIIGNEKWINRLTADFHDPGTLERFDSEGQQSRCQSHAKLVQQSRALYRTSATKVKRQKENRVNPNNARSHLCPFAALAQIPAIKS